MIGECQFEEQKQTYSALCAEMIEFLSSVDGSQFNICAQLYEIILKGEEKDHIKLFAEAVIHYEYIDSNESISAPISKFESQKSELKDRYGHLVNTLIDLFVQRKGSSEIFYENIWNTVQNDTFFPDHGAKVFAFYYILIDRRIPYFELTDGYQMDNDAFKKLYRDYAEQVCKIRYILSTDMNQKTERASLVLKELGIEIPDENASEDIRNEYEKKLIIMVEALKGKSRSSSNALEGLLSKLQELSD